MRGEWVGIVFGVLMLLVGLVQAWRPEEALRTSQKYALPSFRGDWSDDLWLVRLIGVVAALAGLGFLIANLWPA